MQIGNAAMNCMKERIVNLGVMGKIFSTLEDQQKWLFGESTAATGLLGNPRAALAQSIACSGVVHPGVTISDEEESVLNAFLSRLFGKQPAPSLNSLSTGLPDGVSLVCPDLTKMECWY